MEIQLGYPEVCTDKLFWWKIIKLLKTILGKTNDDHMPLVSGAWQSIAFDGPFTLLDYPDWNISENHIEYAKEILRRFDFSLRYPLSICQDSALSPAFIIRNLLNVEQQLFKAGRFSASSSTSQWTKQDYIDMKRQIIPYSGFLDYATFCKTISKEKMTN